MLKVDLHCHTNLDPKDGDSSRKIVTYSPGALFAKAQEEGFDAIALTHHLKLIDTDKIRASALKHNLIYIPGVEVEIEKMHVVLLNPPHDEVKTFSELRKLKEDHPDMLIIAPHPYYPGRICLGKSLIKHIDLFDAIEYSHLYTERMNWFNQRAEKVARKYGVPVVGNSDVHYLRNFGTTFSMVDAQKDLASILSAIKQGKVKHESSPLKKREMVKATLPFAKRIPAIMMGG